MKDSQAIKPSVFNIPSFKQVEVAEKKGATEEEMQLYTLSKQAGWKHLTDFANQAMKELDAINATAIAQGLSFEEIGKNTVIISLAKDIVQRILNKVEDARSGIEDEQ